MIRRAFQVDPLARFDYFVPGMCQFMKGEREEALNWLEHAINKGFIKYPLFAKDNPFLENVRGEERFARPMETIKPEWEKFQAQ